MLPAKTEGPEHEPIAREGRDRLRIWWFFAASGDFENEIPYLISGIGERGLSVRWTGTVWIVRRTDLQFSVREWKSSLAREVGGWVLPQSLFRVPGGAEQGKTPPICTRTVAFVLESSPTLLKSW